MTPYVGEYKRYKQLLEHSLAQLSDEEYFTVLSAGATSVAIVVNHLSGNLRSRFTDFLTTDGEKPWRERETEFEVTGLSRADITGRWQTAWDILEANVWPLTRADLDREVTVRGVALTVEEALARSLSHFSYHVGEIVFIARYFRGADWNYFSIAPGQSAAYNQRPDREKIRP